MGKLVRFPVERTTEKPPVAGEGPWAKAHRLYLGYLEEKAGRPARKKGRAPRRPRPDVVDPSATDDRLQLYADLFAIIARREGKEGDRR